MDFTDATQRGCNYDRQRWTAGANSLTHATEAPIRSCCKHIASSFLLQQPSVHHSFTSPQGSPSSARLPPAEPGASLYGHRAGIGLSVASAGGAGIARVSRLRTEIASEMQRKVAWRAAVLQGCGASVGLPHQMMLHARTVYKARGARQLPDKLRLNSDRR